MFPFGLSLETGLMITIIILLVLYLIVLIKLEPSTEGKRILKTDLLEQRIVEEHVTERRKPVMYSEIREEPVERTKPAPPVPVKTEKIEVPRENSIQGCPHHFGYLSEYPKNTPIPNECLTCTEIMECLLRRE